MTRRMERVATLLLALLPALLVSRIAEAVTTSTIVSGLNGAYGSDYRLALNTTFFVERYTGKIWKIDMNTLASSVIGTGYTEPMDLAISADNLNLYVLENGGLGTLVKVPIATPNRASATVIATSITPPSQNIMGQLALDEAHGHAYVVQNAGFGAIWRIDLSGGAKTLLLSSFTTNPSGLLVDKNAQFAYYTELGLSGTVNRLDLVGGTHQVLVSGLNNPEFMCWGDAAQTTLNLVDSTRALAIDLTHSPMSAQPLATGFDVNTYGIRRITDDRFFVLVSAAVIDVHLSPYDPSGPIFLGIGLVPFDRIVGGLADTTVDPSYFFQVKDSPFGGTLSLMINHPGAYGAPDHARWYQVVVDGVVQQQTWSDYLWDSGLGRFVLQTMSPQYGGYYQVRVPGDLWYNFWLGYRLDTSALTPGHHDIGIRLFGGGGHPGPEIGNAAMAGRHRDVIIDNTWPTAIVGQIYHEGAPVDACAIVQDSCANDHFTFCVTASDPDGYLLAWSLTALWGDNKSALIASDSYVGGPLWYGRTCPPDAVVPSPAWEAVVPSDSTSWNCAHTFSLSVVDRAIDGYGHIHWSGYNKSLTIQLSGCP